ncbi:MAG: hypothetical protein WDO73_21380 [Ignavibacteriota bacterium]
MSPVDRESKLAQEKQAAEKKAVEESGQQNQRKPPTLYRPGEKKEYAAGRKSVTPAPPDGSVGVRLVPQRHSGPATVGRNE